MRSQYRIRCHLCQIHKLKRGRCGFGYHHLSDDRCRLCLKIIDEDEGRSDLRLEAYAYQLAAGSGDGKVGNTGSHTEHAAESSNIVVQSYVNMFPNEVIAGIGVAEKVARWVQIPMQAIATIGTNYVGQNLGAGKYDRVQHGIKLCNLIATVITIICSLAVFSSAEFFVAMFNSDPEIIKYGSAMVRYTVFSYVPLTWSHIYNGCCRGAGNVKLPLVIAVASQCVFKFVFVTIGLKYNFDIQIIYLSNLLTYSLAGLLASAYFHFSRFTKQAHLRP